jgi:hypothetical protein
MILTALVIKTYTRSVEVYVIVQAEGRDGKRRFTNDAFFTMALDSPKEEGDRITSTIRMPPGSALETFANASVLRRQQRLELKQLITRVYQG